MLRKLLTAILLSLFSLSASYGQTAQTTQNAAGKYTDYRRDGAPMPPLVFMSYTDTTTEARALRTIKKYRKMGMDTTYTVLTEKDFDNGANLFVMMFNPTCLHCEDATFMLEKNIDLFKKSKIILLANKVMADYIPDFSERHHIAHLPPMYIGLDSSGFIDNAYLYQALPQINIYGPDRTLLKIYSGDVPMDSLAQYIDHGKKGKRRRR